MTTPDQPAATDGTLAKAPPHQQDASQTEAPAKDTTAVATQPPPKPLSRAERKQKAKQEPTYKEMVQEHRATTERLQDLAMGVEKYAKRVQEQVQTLQARDARVAYLITRVVVDKDRAMLVCCFTFTMTRTDGFADRVGGCFKRSAETELKRTVHSLWKLSREIKAATKTGNEQNTDHDMYELLEGFVKALGKARGADRETWGEEGKELGEVLDRIKADMEWWDDGKEE